MDYIMKLKISSKYKISKSGLTAISFNGYEFGQVHFPFSLIICV